MAKRGKASKHKVFLNYKLWLSAVTGEGIVEESTYQILQLVRERGSLKAAAEELGISYRKAWGDLKKAEELLGYELTEKTRGGKDGGNSIITSRAEKLLEAYYILQTQFDNAVEQAYSDFQSNIESNKESE